MPFNLSPSRGFDTSARARFTNKACRINKAGQGTGVVQIVMPQNWLFLTSYKKQRESLLQRVQWNLLARLGEGGFDSPQAAGAFIILLTQTRAPAPEGFALHGVDASAPKSAPEKALLLREGAVVAVSQKGQLGNPDARVALDEHDNSAHLLGKYAISMRGIVSGDGDKWMRCFWESHVVGDRWRLLQSVPASTMYFSGKEHVIDWSSEGLGMLRPGTENLAYGRKGVALGQMRGLPTTLFCGALYDNNTGVIVPNEESDLAAVWCYCSSTAFSEAVRRIDQKLNVTNATFVKVPFDLAHWQQVAAERYPHGLPKPYSDDPTQWLFHGHPQPATDPLQVAVARLVGYRWPAEQEAATAAGAAEIQAKSASSAYASSASSYQNESIDAATTAPQRAPMELSEAAHTWIARCAALEAHPDDDGICCLPSVRGEAPAHERLLQLLIASWETVEPGSWRPAILDQLLAQADCAGKGLDVWLREKFFEQHAKRFHHRPFVWHVWDGLKDGFAALVNYHRLDAKNLERLIHTYLGAWIGQQEKGVRDGVDGAPTRLAAAQDLKRRLELILEGEKPYDIFVRWKSLAEQPIGWNPDLNDGVRLNIRPFMTAEVLRHNRKPKLNITWDKDRGKDVESAPWFAVFGGDRINDHHLTLAEKRAARDKAERS